MNTIPANISDELLLSEIHKMNSTFSEQQATAAGSCEGTKSSSTSAVMVEVPAPPKLWNRCKANVPLMQERPMMRAAAELTAKGYKEKEVAERLGVTAGTVRNWLRQDCMSDVVPQEIQRIMGADEEVVEIIKENVANAVQCLADIVNNPKAKESSRIAAANALLDRRYGRPNQPINRGGDIDLNSLSDAELVKMLPETERTTTTTTK